MAEEEIIKYMKKVQDLQIDEKDKGFHSELSSLNMRKNEVIWVWDKKIQYDEAQHFGDGKEGSDRTVERN